ncbi:MAG TPA: hypothetical protein VFH23_04140 [Jiangellaceae bacterium]|nr:hypothetical protein [Jiangellaceae bacterium]
MPGSPLPLTDPTLEPNEEVTLTLTCSNLNEGGVVTADLNTTCETNSLVRVISGSQASIRSASPSNPTDPT